MIRRLYRWLRRPNVPRSPGRQVFLADAETREAARRDFSCLPFSVDMPSTASQEALPPTGRGGSERVEAFLGVLGRLPSRIPATATLLATWDCGDYFQEYVTLQSTQGPALPAYVLVPKDASGPRPAVLAIHGHGGDFLWGKSKVTAARKGNPTYGYGLRLVRRGYVVLAPDLPAFEDRGFTQAVKPGPWISDVERLLFGNLLLKGATLLGWNLFELSQAVDYLAARDDIDKERIGVIGHSMGGTLAPLLALFDRRVQAVVACCGLSTWKAMMARHVIHNFSCYVPGLLQQVGDIDVLLAALAPTPFMMIVGEQDDNFPVTGVRQLSAALQKSYAAAGAGDALEVRIDGGGHHFHDARQEMAMAFLARWLLREGIPAAVQR